MSFEDWSGEAKKRLVSVFLPNRLFRFRKLDNRLIEMTADETEAIGEWFLQLAEKSREPELTVVHNRRR